MSKAKQVMFYIAETAIAAKESDVQWGDCYAQSLEGAQKSAISSKMFTPSALWVGVGSANDVIKAVCVRREDGPNGLTLGWMDV